MVNPYIRTDDGLTEEQLDEIIKFCDESGMKKFHQISYTTFCNKCGVLMPSQTKELSKGILIQHLKDFPEGHKVIIISCGAMGLFLQRYFTSEVPRDE